MTKYHLDGDRKNNNDATRTSKKTGKARLTWIAYLYGMRRLLAHLENAFESLGNSITSHPKLTIFIALSAALLSAFGLLRMHVEKRTEKLFVPQNSLAEQALKAGNPYFNNFLNTRVEEIIFTSKGNLNVLKNESLGEIAMVVNSIKDIPGYKTLCKPLPSFLKTDAMFDGKQTCQQQNIMEILKGQNFSQEYVFNSLYTARYNSTLLMSNGRVMAAKLPDSIEKFQLNVANRIASAKSIRVVLFMKRSDEKNMAADILVWESKFVKQLEDFNAKLKHLKLYYSAERSMEDAISESSTSDIGLVSITFAVMSTFACLTLSKFVNPVRGHNWLAFSGIFSTALGILSGIGLTMLFGLPFISLVGVVPFLVVSIGIDDMFIIVDEFDRLSSKHEPRRRVSYSLSKVGATITMTTVTDIIAFLVSATSEFPAVRYFCIYTAICVTLEFVLQITLFVAFLTLDAIRIKNSRRDLIPCVVAPDKNVCGPQNENSMASMILNKFARVLLKPPVKAIVVVISLGMIAFGVFGCLNIDTQFNRQTLALKGSHFAEYVNYYEKSYPQNVPVNIQLVGSVDYSDPVVRKKIIQAVTIAYNTGYYESRNFSWIHSFDDFTSRHNIRADGLHFKQALVQFLNSTHYAQHNLDVILDNNNNIIASRVIVFYKDNTNSEFQKDAMVKFRNELSKQSDLEFTLASNPFIFFEQFAIVIKEVVINLVMVSLIIVVVLVPFCIHPVIILFILIGFVALVVELFGLMYLWDVQLNSISMINMVMSIGFSVDYSTHIAHAFVTSSQESADQRIIEALTTVGGSVLLGGASTFLGMSLTGFASSPIFQIFFKMFIGIILFGLYNGLVLLPVLLSIFARIVNVRKKYVFKPEDFSTFPLSWRNYSRKKTQTKVSPARKASVSVMGMSTRLPTAKTTDEFWTLLKEGRNTITEYPDNRYARKMYFDDSYHPSKAVAGKIYVSRGSYLEGIDGFDYTFFGITPTEAKMMDPQQRMLLQGTYEAIEDAGMTLDELQQCNTGVYVGIMNQDYNSVVLGKDSFPNINQFTSTGNAFSMAANRISFSLNLSGPSLATDTACSSSLTALNIACDHLEKGIVDVAIVGAANLILCANTQAPICQANMLAVDGKCKVFDEAADGYGRGEGVIVFVLKSSEFVHVTDRPYCELIAWGMNNDGKSAAPITAPSAESQKKLVNIVLQEGSINAKDIQYVEMHGTGTIIGDKVEVTSVGEVYGASREATDPVIVGSVKSNINHTESVAGLAGLAKICLMMKHKEFVPTVGVTTPSTRLGIEQNRLHVQTECSPWPKNVDGMPRLAAVNSFGFGGSNAHVIVKEISSTNQEQGTHNSSEPQNLMLVLSASSSEALSAMAKRMGIWLESIEDTMQNRIDICYTFSERKTTHNMRLVVDASSLKTASNALKEFNQAPEEKLGSLCFGKAYKFSSQLGFVFGGQGTQWLGMAGDLLRNQDILQTINTVDKIAKGVGHEDSILAYLNPEVLDKGNSEPSLATIQLSIFALQYAVAKFLINKAGIVPLFVCGHSLGDITAACIANVISLKDAVKIVRTRAYLQDSLQANGAMLAIGLESIAVKEICDKLEVKNNVCIAAENDRNSVTVSGDEDAITKIENYFKQEKSTVFCRRLDTRKAFHSHHMEPMRSQFMKKIGDAGISTKTADIRFFSTTEGKEMKGNEIDDCYWWKNLREQVSFRQAAEKMIENGARTLIEITPRPVVSHYLNEIAKEKDIRDITVLQAMPRRKEPQRLRHLLVQCIGKMYTLGYSVNFTLLQTQTNAKFHRVPTYPWQETALWANDEYCGVEKTSLLLGAPISVAAEQTHWENEFGFHFFEFFRDHQIKGLGHVVPGACYIEMAFESVLMGTKIEPLVITDIKFQNTLPLNEESIRRIKCAKVKPDELRITLLAEHGEVVLSTAKLGEYRKTQDGNYLTLTEACLQPEVSNTTSEETADAPQLSTGLNPEKALQDANDQRMLQNIQLTANDKLKDGVFADFIATSNFVFGDKFCLIDSSWGNDKEALARIKLPEWLRSEMHHYVIHPCIIDACTQTLAVVEAKKTDSFKHVLPIGLDEVTLYPIEQRFHYLYCYAEKEVGPSEISRLKLMDENGNVIMQVNGFAAKEVSAFDRQTSLGQSIYQVNWTNHNSSNSNSSNNTQPQSFPNDSIFVILGETKSPWISNLTKALSELNVSDHDTFVVQLDFIDDFDKFMARTLELIVDVSKKGKKIVIINLLTIMASDIPLASAFSEKAECLCFESTLTILKLLNEKDMKESVVVVLTNKSFANEGSADDVIHPWAATSWGMAKVTNLECAIPVICVDVNETSLDICKKAILSIGMESAENGMIVTPQQTLQPSLERVDSTIKPQFQKENCLEDTEFYLSWSNQLKAFFAKKETKSERELPGKHVEVKTLHTTSLIGQCRTILDNVKSYDSKAMTRTVVGVVTKVSECESDIQVGDHVVGFLQSKWIKSSVLVPLQSVFKKPLQCLSENAAVLSGCLLFSHHILKKIFTINPRVKSMLVVSTPSSRGLCRVIAAIAEKSGVNATSTDDDLHPNECSATSRKVPRLSPFIEQLEKERGQQPVFDCIICSSDLHPTDNTTINDILIEDGVLAVIDIDGNIRINEFNSKKAVTIINFRPSHVSLEIANTGTPIEQYQADLSSLCQTDIPRIDAYEVTDICASGFQPRSADGEQYFSCINMDVIDKEMAFGSASIDFQGLKENRSYVVVGGTKGLGLSTVKWMASRGAGVLIPLSRSDVPSDSMNTFKNLEVQFGSKIMPLKLDISSQGGITTLEEELKNLPSIAGIVNSAGVLDDKMFADIDRSSYQKVMIPKINGTLLLHEMLERIDAQLDFFVLYSSSTSVLGNTGQTSYSAANAFLNSFADYRVKSLKKPCTAVCWGAMGGAGMLHRDTAVAELLQKGGIHQVDIKTGLKWMETVMTSMPDQTNFCIVDVDWPTYFKTMQNKVASSVFFRSIRKELPTNQNEEDELLNGISKAKTTEKKQEIVLNFIVQWLAKWIGGNAEEVDCNVPFFTYGIDSIGASVFKLYIFQNLKIEFEVFYFMLPETTASSLSSALVDAINQNSKQQDNSETSTEEAQFGILEDSVTTEFRGRQTSRRGPFHSFRAVAPSPEEEKPLVLPNDYLSCIYDPPDAKAKLFIVHPSHRYAGVFQAMAAGMKFQDLFSVYVFGSQDPGYIGEDIGSVTRLAKACTEMVLKIQPYGPYFLGGYSFGGLVAIEIAANLHKLGMQTAQLIMIDTLHWVPEAKSNHAFLMESFGSFSRNAESILLEQVREFLNRFATSRLSMTQKEFDMKADEMKIEDLARFLNERATQFDPNLPDMQKIFQSTFDDHVMSAKYHAEWIPPMNTYDGPVLYIEAESCLCKKSTESGGPSQCFCSISLASAPNSWSSVFKKKIYAVKCPGNHFSIMDQGRGQNVGKVLAVNAALRYREIFPMIGRIALNANHTTTVAIFKERGMRVYFFQKAVFKNVSSSAVLKINKSQTKLKFTRKSSNNGTFKISLKDIVSIKMQERNDLDDGEAVRKAAQLDVHSGYRLLKKDLTESIVMCFNRQDFQRLTYLLEAAYRFKLPV